MPRLEAIPSREVLYVRHDVPRNQRTEQDYVRMRFAYGLTDRGYTQEGRLASPWCVPPRLVTGLARDAYRADIDALKAARAEQIKHRLPLWALRFVGNAALTGAITMGLAYTAPPVGTTAIVFSILASAFIGTFCVKVDYERDMYLYNGALGVVLALNDMVTVAHTGQKREWMQREDSVAARRRFNPQVFDAAARELAALGHPLPGIEIEFEPSPVAPPSPVRLATRPLPPFPRLVSPERTPS